MKRVRLRRMEGPDKILSFFSFSSFLGQSMSCIYLAMVIANFYSENTDPSWNGEGVIYQGLAKDSMSRVRCNCGSAPDITAQLGYRAIFIQHFRESYLLYLVRSTVVIWIHLRHVRL